MFSLIITIVAIALVALLALATLYYGGSTFQKGDAAAKAAKLLNEGQQLLGAADLYRADTGNWPDSIATLITGNYLTAQPGNQVSLLGVEFEMPQLGLGAAVAAETAVSPAWEMPKAGVPTFKIGQASTEVCAEVNRKSYGLAGVLTLPRNSLINQCYGASSPSYTMLVSKEPKGLSEIPGVSDVVVAVPVPTDTDSPEWSTKPGSLENGGGKVGLPTLNTPVVLKVDVPELTITTSNGTGYGVVQVTNTSARAVEPKVVLSGPFDMDWDGCAGYEIGQGESCSVYLTYTSTNPAVVSGEMVVSANNGNTLRVALSGIGSAKVASGDYPIALSMAFGSSNPATSYHFPVPIQSSSSFGQRLVITVTNDSGVALTGLEYTKAGSYYQGFPSVNEDECKYATLQPGESCRYTVRPQYPAGEAGYVDFQVRGWAADNFRGAPTYFAKLMFYPS